ncbi:hypothetical protein GCM10027282_20760 [Frigoribacterium salinisoli]
MSLVLVAVARDAPPWAPVAALAPGATWLLLARPALRGGVDRVTAPALVAVLAVLATGLLAAAALPQLAVQQAFLMPLLWNLVPRAAQAIGASALLSLSVGAGFLLSVGTTRDALVTAVTSQALSFAFSLALGLWITSIARVGEERGRLLAELRAAQAELAARSRDDGTVAERERLAREIHDTIAQSLTGLVMLAQQSRGSLATGDVAAAGARLDLIEDAARHALTEARTLVAATASPGPDGTGLVVALRRVVERFTRESGVPVDLDVAPATQTGPVGLGGLPTPTGPGDVPRDVQVVLVRCAQEALANVRKHAGPATARVALLRDGDDVVLSVADDGTGFDTAAPRSGFGLDGLAERLALAGGRLEVASSSAGTTVSARLPVAVPPTRGPGA